MKAAAWGWHRTHETGETITTHTPCTPRMTVMRCGALRGAGALRIVAGRCSGDRIASQVVIVLPAVPLWKVNVGVAADKTAPGPSGPAFFLVGVF